MKKGWLLYSKSRGFYLSDEPGQFAAITTQKIAGRLDCHSGKRASPKNRIFLRYLDDMPEGFRPCKICKPEVLRVGDRLHHLEARGRSLVSVPHVSLWVLGIVRENDTYEPRRWYAAMNWERETEGRHLHGQLTMSDTHLYHRALSLALKEGKRLNLPVVKQALLDIVVLWLPPRESTDEEKELVRVLQTGEVANIYGYKPIEFESSGFGSDEELE